MNDIIYHVSPEQNRKSIRANGLKASTEDNRYQPKGVYAWNDLDSTAEAHGWFGKADVWGIKTTGRKRIFDDPNTSGVFTSSNVSPKNLILIRHVGWDAKTGHRVMHEGDDRNCMDCLRFTANGGVKHRDFILDFSKNGIGDPGGSYDSHGFCTEC